MRRRVAILGGGCAGVGVAHALSRTEALRRRFEVTVYEQSWRLGGKGATGRDPDHGQRIEEHGLHVWMGFYRHAFGAARECLEAWQPPPGCPLRTFEDAFSPRYGFRVGEWSLRLPPRPGLPGDPGARTSSITDELAFAASMLRALVSGQAPWGKVAGLARLGATVARGLAAEMCTGGDLWARMDEHDLRGWLRRHGASTSTVRSPVVRAFYDMAFAYPDGVADDARGSVAAGAALRSILRLLFTYRGAPMWQLRHGMGDTVFVPMYETLRRRGVRFEFFHRTDRLEPSPDGSRIDRVATTRLRASAHDYEPLLDVQNMPVWPSEPRSDAGPPTSATRMLERGRDFDDVVLAIPSGALRPILTDVARIHRDVATMLEHSHTVATKAAQLWLAYPLPSELHVVTGTPGPFATAANLSEVLDAEAWSGPKRPRGLAYLVDTMPTPDDDQNAERLVAADVQRWCEVAAEPILGRAPQQVSPPYVRANVHGWERYVLSLPGTTKHRIAPDGTRIGNLRLAGDWVKTSINGGSVEAAFESAQAAADSLG